jgi:hypothetical protein
LPELSITAAPAKLYAAAEGTPATTANDAIPTSSQRVAVTPSTQPSVGVAITPPAQAQQHSMVPDAAIGSAGVPAGPAEAPNPSFAIAAATALPQIDVRLPAPAAAPAGAGSAAPGTPVSDAIPELAARSNTPIQCDAPTLTLPSIDP